MCTEQIYELLSHIGASPSYKGCHYLAYIVCRIVEQSNGPSPFLMKDYYADASQRFHTTPDSIQQSIRTFLKNYWMLENGKHFQKVTGYRGAVPIPPKDFIAVLVDHLLKNSARI